MPLVYDGDVFTWDDTHQQGVWRPPGPGYWVNVKDFGAVGDGVADDTAAITAAVASLPGGGVVLLPAGSFKISAPIVTTKPIVFRGVGALNGGGGFFGTRLLGNFGDYLIRFDMAGIWPGSSVEDMALINAHASGGGIRGENLGAVTRFSNLYAQAYRGLTLISNVFSIFVSNCALYGPGGAPAGGWGAYVAGHTQFTDVDVVGNDVGLRLNGFGVTVMGARIEVNRTGIQLGVTDTGATGASAGTALTGIWFEANDTAFNPTNGATSYSLNESRIHGTVNSPSGQSVYGVNSSAASQPGSFRNVIVAGEYSRAAVSSRGYATFENVVVDNGLGILWDIANPQTCVFTNTDYEPTGVPGVEAPHLTATQFVRSIAAADQIRGFKQGKNLRGINVAVPSGATFVDVEFPNLTTGNSPISTATATGSGATIPTGQYFYVATLVNEAGETAALTEKSVAVTLGQRVDIAFSFGVSGTQKNWRRRVYRGTSSGVYQGYFDLPLESSATFSDTGQAFTGKKSPPEGSGADGTEPDANYAVNVAPGWVTSWGVSNKTTSGFRINFGTAPGSSSTLDWILIR